jgi:hypothetical protein
MRDWFVDVDYEHLMALYQQEKRTAITLLFIVIVESSVLVGLGLLALLR